MENTKRKRVAIACQGGGSHTAFTAGFLQGLLAAPPEDVEIVALSGTSGGAICATLAWEGFLRGDLSRASTKLQTFWDAMSAREPWDKFVNQTMTNLVSLRDLSLLPEISPYHLPTWGEERFRDLLLQNLDFQELRNLARAPGAPILQIGAVEVLSGRFDLFLGEELRVECLLASAAIPELFRAITVPGRGVYWDGLFSQNPPIRDLLAHAPDEIWVIQINADACSEVPTETHEILDRRNELSGNLSMVQELYFIEAINRAIRDGSLNHSKRRIVQVERIQLNQDLHYRSKLDRRPELLHQLMEAGREKWRCFSAGRGATAGGDASGSHSGAEGSSARV